MVIAAAVLAYIAIGVAMVAIVRLPGVLTDGGDGPADHFWVWVVIGAAWPVFWSVWSLNTWRKRRMRRGR